MYTPDTLPRQPAPDQASLEQQVHILQERLAFYEGFDRLIQDNVAHARELFRLAAMERETAASAAARAKIASGEREAALRDELSAIAADVDTLAAVVDTLSQRIARALGDAPNGWVAPHELTDPRAVAVVVHGVPSARTALSLQRFIASLPQVSDVSAREFAGGVLRLDASVQEQLHVAQFQDWEDPRRIEPLTERPDVIELTLQPALDEAGGGRREADGGWRIAG